MRSERTLHERTLRGKVAIVGIGETDYFKYGGSPVPEFKMALKAVLSACRDARLDPRAIDGITGFGDERTDPSRLSAALGMKRLRATSLQWGGGGGGNAAAIANGAASIVAGLADCVVVIRVLAQGQYRRFGKGQATGETISGDQAYSAPYGLISPAQKFAMKSMRFMADHGVRQDALKAIALASYHHAQANPRAVMHGRPLSAEKYDASRWIVEPYHLYDCCMENDGACALLMVPAERARDFPNRPVYVLGAASGSDYRCGATAHNAPNYPSSSFTTLAPDLYGMARVGPRDIGSVQAYENFTAGVLMALVEHGFFKAEEANDFMRLDNLIAPDGGLPLNTSGGNLAECYVHGLQLVVEAVRQVRGTATSQAKRNDVAMVIGGPMVSPVSNLILGSEATL